MILPSIDLKNGRAVQLVGGREEKIDAGDPRPIAEQFRVAGEIAVVDLDAALGQGDNASVMEDLLRIAPCRVGGGIRSVDAAIRWLDAGATKVVIGTAATADLLRELPADRVIVALDATDGEVVTHGWQTRSGDSIEQRLSELRPYSHEFLVTFVEREGRMTGIDPDRVRQLAQAADGAMLTIAGGVRDTQDIATLDRLGVNVQIGMALYSGAISLADALTAPMQSDRADGLWPTVVTDERGIALGLAYSNGDSVQAAVDLGRGVYYSRSRQSLWEKGATSGATQELLRIDLDCDRDALRFTVRQNGSGFCHIGTTTCWGQTTGLSNLEQTLRDRAANAPSGSYSARLFAEPDLLDSKILEEAQELVRASTATEIIHEAADVIYFTMARLRAAGVDLADVEAELDRRALKFTRRPGNAKSPSAAQTGGVE